MRLIPAQARPHCASIWGVKRSNPVYYRKRLIRMRLKVYDAYGGKCEFCGDDRFEVLEIDHIGGSGHVHRAELGGESMYTFLARTEVRRDLYRLLCASCHTALTYYGVSPDGLDFVPIEVWRYWASVPVPTQLPPPPPPPEPPPVPPEIAARTALLGRGDPTRMLPRDWIYLV